MNRLTLVEATQVAAILNSSIGYHYEDNKIVQVRGFAQDDNNRAGIELVDKKGKQLAIIAVDFAKKAIVLVIPAAVGRMALQALLEENHDSVFSAAQRNVIAISSFIAWEIATDSDLVQSLISEIEGNTLKAGQRFLKEIESSIFDNKVATALSYLDLDTRQLDKIGWLSNNQKSLLLIEKEKIDREAKQSESFPAYLAWFNKLEDDEVAFTSNALKESSKKKA